MLGTLLPIKASARCTVPYYDYSDIFSFKPVRKERNPF